MRNVSKNVNDDVITYSSLETLENVKSCYSRVNQFYLLTFPASSITYCFDLRYPLQDGSSRTTTWTDINPKALYETKAGTLYLGKASNLAKYYGYNDNSSTYRMSYFTTWIDFGNPMQTSIFKKAILTLIGFQTQSVVFKWAYDFSVNYFSQTQTLSGVSSVAEYGIAEYGIDEYSGSVSVNTLSSYGSGSGKVLQFGIETDINGFNLSVQRIDLYTKNGRLQ